MKIAVTGCKGLLGWHAAARLHAKNCAARYLGRPEPFDIVLIDRALMDDASQLAKALDGTKAVLHFAGVNRGNDDEVEAANPQIAERLIAACRANNITPHIVYANSIHAATRATPYGRSKRIAGERFMQFNPQGYTDLVLPHIFGECARPYYNNVTATLIDQIWKGDDPEINPDGQVQLLHSGEAAQIAIDAAIAGGPKTIAPQGKDISIPDLYGKLLEFHTLYMQNVFPDVSDPFDLALFNSYRAGAYPERFVRPLQINRDDRGMLFESAKGGCNSQTFISITPPEKKRGDHFHSDLVERFVVISGKAVIRVRKVLTDQVHEFVVSGDEPVAIDQIPFHTHNIENLGADDLVTFFWSHRIFDPSQPDTYSDPV
jgi:UDP-2-acetamido-2,6-beta-L-arabino-hexul-4-ose reductase